MLLVFSTCGICNIELNSIIESVMHSQLLGVR